MEGKFTVHVWLGVLFPADLERETGLVLGVGAPGTFTPTLAAREKAAGTHQLVQPQWAMELSPAPSLPQPPSSGSLLGFGSGQSLCPDVPPRGAEGLSGSHPGDFTCSEK